MRRRKCKPTVALATPPCPRCNEPLWLTYWNQTRPHKPWRCEEHGTMSDYEPKFRRVTTSLGSCWVVDNIRIIDDVPSLRLSGLPSFPADEWDVILSLPLAERRARYERRKRDIAEENELCRQDPLRSVFGPSGSAARTVMEEQVDWI